MREAEAKFERGGVFKISLLEDRAPKTCDLFWNALPLEGAIIHASRAGNEIFIPTKMAEKDTPRENFSAILKAGEVALWSENWLWREETYPLKETLCICYGTALAGDFRGPQVFSIIGKITENLNTLAEVGKRIGRQGSEKVTITRK